MVRCFILHDVQSQYQHSACQRKEELLNAHEVDEEDDDGSYTNSGDVPQTQVHVIQEEEVYHVTNDNDTTSNEYINESSARRGNNFQKSGGNLQLSIGSGSRGGRRRQSFETSMQETIIGYTKFQKQSLQQLRLCAFDKGKYDEWKKAEELFLAFKVSKGCLNTQKELVLWRSNNMGHHQIINNGGTPPNTQPWGTPPNVQPWGTPPNAQHWGTPPNAQLWGTPPNIQQWRTPPNAQQRRTPSNAQQWGTPPNISQNYQQGSSSGTTAPNV
ncbi:hypothetical protein N665_1120s0006 [Sinapis alba]|nr:hypothetical protein N665_1120s0006 [Sinapis alba]